MSDTVRSAAVRLTMENASYIRGANQAATVTEVATGRMQRSVHGAAVSTSRDFETMGKYGGRAALVVGAGLAAVVKVTADFSSEMALVRTLSHANVTEMDKLSNAALTVGRNIGYSAKEVAQGEEEMIKAGVSVKDILGGGLTGALDLAAAGQTDVATATTIAASAMTQFKLKGKDIPHLADLLSAGADKALGSVEDLGYGLEQSGTTAHQMGLSIEQTVGTLAAFAQAGLIGERGGTTFKQMLLQLAAPTGQASKLMEKYGLSLYNANGQIKTMPQLAGNLREAFGKLDPAQRNAALGVIFGSRAIQGANILMADGRTEIAKWISKVNDQGFAAGQASGKLDSLSGDVKKFKSTLSTAFIEAGSPSQRALRGIVQDADHLVRAFQGLPGDIQQGIVKTAALTTAVGGTLFIANKIRKVFSDLAPIGRGRGGAGRGIAGTLGEVASSAKPIPVYVTNLGPGGLGTGAPGSGGTPPVVAPGGKAPKGAPLGAFGLALGLGFATAGALADRPVNSGRVVIDDKFLKTHVVVDGHWYTKTEWDKQKVASDDALLWLVSGGKKGSRTPKPPKVLEDPLGSLLNPKGKHNRPKPKEQTSEDILGDYYGIHVKKLKPVNLLHDITGLADVFGKPTPAKPEKNPVKQLSASMGLDTSAFDKKTGQVKKTASVLNALSIVPSVNVKGVPEAMSATAALKSLLDSLHDRNINIKVTKSTNANLAEASAVHPARGGLITGPGTGTSDSIPAYVSNGEYVMRAAAVRKYGTAMFDRYNAMRFAGGGSVGDGIYQSAVQGAIAAGIVVQFPPLSALAAAVAAADHVAADAVTVTRSAKDVRQQNLDDLHTQQQIRDLAQQLHARNKKHKLELRGLDRKAAQAELADAKATLLEIRTQKKTDLEEARKAAIAEEQQKRQDATDALTSTSDIFARGTSPASAVASVNRTVADISQYGQVMGSLKSAGASPALLQQLMNRAQTGDFRSAIRLGRALLAQPATLGQLNASLATLGTVSSSVATMTTDPRFLGTGAWAPTSTSVVQVNLAADPSSWLLEVRRVIQFEVEAQMASVTR